MVVGLITVLLGFSLTGILERIERRLHGVRPGVTLEGVNVSGLHEPEVRRLVEQMTVKSSRPPENARIDKESGKVLPGRTGILVDIDSTVKQVIRAPAKTSLSMVRVGVRPEVEADILVQITRPLGSYTTWITGSAGRASNIRLAGRQIHNTLLLPGEVFSFNQVVGPRTAARGYMSAPVIVGEALVPGVGGGICQVSSTLYNAVLRAKLRVVERHGHSLPVRYVPPGRDATVNWPDLDVKFRNSRRTPILIRVYAGSQIHVQILGIPDDRAVKR